MDLELSESQARFADVYSVMQERNLPYPLVAVNGELRLAGSAHYYHLMPIVDELVAQSASGAEPAGPTAA